MSNDDIMGILEELELMDDLLDQISQHETQQRTQ